MNRTRFYEILKAHEKGEDLSQFVPKNPAEAALIANLQGGSGSSGGGMPDFVWNNPDLPNLYYGMMVANKTIRIDVNKIIEAYSSTISFDSIVSNSSGSATFSLSVVSLLGYNSGDNGNNGYDLDIFLGPNAYHAEGQSDTQGAALYFIPNGNGSIYTLKSVALTGSQTLAEYLMALANEEGIIEITLDDEFASKAQANMDPGFYLPAIFVYKLGRSASERNLNENPIDWIEIV